MMLYEHVVVVLWYSYVRDVCGAVKIIWFTVRPLWQQMMELVQ